MADELYEAYGIGRKPCPFCGSKPEWIRVPGDDYIMRCSNCHASTTRARMNPDEAAADWNDRRIEDNNYTVISDIKIDEYLKTGIKKIIFTEYSIFDSFPETDDGFLCSEAFIITDKINLCIETYGDELCYDVIHGHSEIGARILSAKDADIIFRESRWQGDTLRSLAFVFGGKQFTVAASAEEECMTVKVEPRSTETV